jgi:hypothetical protein
MGTPVFWRNERLKSRKGQIKMKNLTEQLLEFLVDNAYPPNKKSAHCVTLLKSVHKSFAMWTLELFCSALEKGRNFTGLINLDTDEFEEALSWCFVKYEIPARVFTDNEYGINFFNLY